LSLISVTTGDLAQKLGCPVEGREDLLLNGVETIEGACEVHLTFLANMRYKQFLPSCKAGAIITTADCETPDGMVRLISTNPYEDFQRAVEILYTKETPEVATGIDPSAVISGSAVIGDNPHIGPNVHVEAGARIGANCVVFTNAYIGRDTLIGDDCIIGVSASIRHEINIGNRVFVGDGTVIGYDGFGYVPSHNGYQRIRPVGTVEIGDDVHIGANCCIDRATAGATRIAKGCKLDNLIQIAHGVEIGEYTAIAAQTGISGSTRVGSWVMMGGQVGLVGHLEIGDQMQIGAQAGVTKSFDTKGLIAGYPARPHMELRRIDAALSRLPELLKRVKALEEKLKKES
jgi:UDP-3-O-[3-hydroxymyristoyl] glucosamine N-acyltransferase